MLNKILNKKNRDGESGFTIIEVLIVLAIAGLILVVVLIAIPQLQRNQRNSARQNEAARVATSVSNWVANNNGAVFTAGTNNANLNAVISDVGNLSQYTLTTTGGSNATFSVVAYSSNVGTVTNLNNMRVVTGAACGQNGAVVAGVSRGFVVQYATETTGNPLPQCAGV